jgi:hypothetical protein
MTLAEAQHFIRTTRRASSVRVDLVWRSLDTGKANVIQVTSEPVVVDGSPARSHPASSL